MIFAYLTLFIAGVAAQCDVAPDCTTCLSGSVGASCGWCAVNTTSATSVGPKCADLKSTFDCDIQFQTDTCSQGYVCGTGTNKSQCVPGVGGISDKQKCEETCASPPPSPSPSPSAGQYTCDFSAADPAGTPPMCMACNATNGTDPSQCSYATEDDCSKSCDWKYKCNRGAAGGPTCEKAQFGADTMQDCTTACQEIWECDDAAAMCKSVNASTPGLHPFKDNATCSAECPAAPKPVPYEVRGIWRGLQIQNSYTTGEWVANITADFMEIWYPVAGGKYELYVKGATVSYTKAPQYVLICTSTAGKLTGETRFIASDYSMNPEVAGFLQLAVDEQTPSQQVADFDTGMTSGSSTVLSLETCPAGATPPAPPPKDAPPPPPPPSPPPCKAKLDIVLVLDGSASIRSTDWQTGLQFTNKVVEAFDIGPDAVKIGALQFSDTTRDIIELSADKAAIKAAIGSERQMMQNTNTGAGFTAAKTMLATHGRATNDGQLVILITDGKPNRGVNPKTVADSMKAIGIEIFGIGVGPSVDAAEIQTWVTAPTTNHYFAASNWAALNKILQDLVANACKHPPVANFLLEEPNPSQNCLFHLPGGLPQTRRRALANKVDKALELELAPVETIVTASDTCNNFTTCEDCIGQRTTHSTCGWCTGDLTYKGVPSTAHCAGKETSGAASEWTCSGHYQTSSCTEPASCGLEGIYRGLRIDNGYEFGEWSALFTPGKGKDQATFKFLDPAGSPTSVSGTIKCDKKCEEGTTIDGVQFTFTTTAGDIQHGICGYTNQVQKETTGLMWAISDKGVATSPKDFDDAMLNKGATVYTYYACSKFKQQCKFVAP